MPKNIKHDWIKLFAFSGDLKQGDVIKIQILKFANRVHPLYGKLLIDQKYFNNLINNFTNNVRKDEIPINMEHDRTKAQAWVKKVYQEWDGLFADIELTKDGADNLNGKHYKYYSAEISDKYQDPDTWKRFDNVLVGGALTNYPYFNGMEKIVASNPEDTPNKNPLFIKKENAMNLKELLKKFSAQAVLSFADKAELLKAFNDAPAEEQAEVATEVEAVVEKKEEDTEKEDLRKELSNLKAEKMFADTKLKFGAVHAFNQVEEEAKTEAEKVLKAYSKLDAEELEMVFKFHQNYQAVIETLTGHQFSTKATAKKEWEEEDKKMSKDGKKQVVSEEKFAKICNDYAKDKGVDFNKAYEALKGDYEIEKKK